LAATPSGWWSNRYSGLAIEGFDPVAYFTDSIAVQGVADFEASESGAVWALPQRGNRASFVAHPEVYGPQFGGYDPVDLGRGVTYAGNPRFWLVTDSGFYLFGREKAATPSPPIRPVSQRRQRALAGAGTDPWRSNQDAAEGSPQAMNSGTMKSARPRRNAGRRLSNP